MPNSVKANWPNVYKPTHFLKQSWKRKSRLGAILKADGLIRLEDLMGIWARLLIILALITAGLDLAGIRWADPKLSLALFYFLLTLFVLTLVIQAMAPDQGDKDSGHG